ncbi:MAG: hypothetical protein ABFD12_00425 [Syntrophorhabdus sp.]
MTFEDWWIRHEDDLYDFEPEALAGEAWQAAQGDQKECVTELLDYAQHDSWRCGYDGECHCGLNAITERFGLPAVPLPEKGESK